MSDKTRLTDFIWNCRRIVEDLGSVEEHRLEIGVAAIGWQFNPNGAKAFKDDVVTIVCEAEPSLALLVISIQDRNPVLCIDSGGDKFRQSAVFANIEDHVAKLCRQALAKHLARMSPEAGGHGIVSMDHILALGDVIDAVDDIFLDVGNRATLKKALDHLNATPLIE